MRDRYRNALEDTVVASAFPYGYTLTIWTSGAVLAHARGLPTTADAFLFMGGALIGFATVALIALRGFTSRRVAQPVQVFSLWGAFHLLSIGVAIATAAAVAHLVHNKAAWLLVGLLATALYLTVSAFQITLVEFFQGENQRQS
jgi:hypothetical protein